MSTAWPIRAAIAASSIAGCRRCGRTAQPLIWVEKILAPFETLRTDWSVDGTTGYDFMDEASGVLHDPAGEAPLTTLWTEQTGRSPLFEEEARQARRQILRDNLASELNATAAALQRVARRTCATRDFTLHRPAPGADRGAGAFPGLPPVHLDRRAQRRRQAHARLGAGRRAADGAGHRPAADRPAGCLAGRRPPRSLPPVLRRDRLRPWCGSSSFRAPSAAQGGRGHRVLPLRPAALAQRGRLRPGALRGDPGRLPRGQPGPRRRTSRAPCSPPRRTTTSAARTSAPGWPCCRSCPASGSAAVRAGSRPNAFVRSAGRDAPRRTMSAQLMLHQMWSAPGRSAWRRGPRQMSTLSRAGRRLAGEGLREAKRRTELGGAERRLRGRLPGFIAASWRPTARAICAPRSAVFVARIAPGRDQQPAQALLAAPHRACRTCTRAPSSGTLAGRPRQPPPGRLRRPPRRAGRGRAAAALLKTGGTAG